MIPIGDENPTSRRPWVNWALIAANGAVFVALNLSGGTRFGELSEADAREWGLLPGQLSPLSFLSCIFVHANWLHLAGNMLFLHVFGDNVEDKLGRLGYLVFYLAAGVAASAAFLLFGRTFGSMLGPAAAERLAAWNEMPLVGASGAIAGVMGTYVVFFPKARIRVLWIFFFIGVYAWPAYLFIGLAILQDFMNAALLGSQLVGGVAYAAHLGGAATGILVGLVLKPILRGRTGTVWDRDTGFNERVREEAPYGRVSPGWESPRSVPLPHLRDQLTGAVLDGRMDLALDLYGRWVAEPRAETLPPEVEIEVAHEICRRGDLARALDAYRRYLGSHPRGGDTAEAKFRIGLLHARGTGNRAAAREWLLQAASEHSDPETVAYARRELQRLEEGGR